jgi:membrane protease YdiL (CAAX protease family)
VIFLSRALFPTNYLFSSLYKIIFLAPLFYRLIIEKRTFRKALAKHFSLNVLKKYFGLMALYGIGFAFIFVLTFFILEKYLDFQIIVSKLQEAASINLGNLIFIGIYIIFVNSLLEEFFWRGFLFKHLRESIKPWMAYALTGIAFSFYHIMFYYNWFNVVFLIIATLGLAAYATAMNLIFQKYKDLFSCWLVHGIADMAMIFVAFQVFNTI